MAIRKPYTAVTSWQSTPPGGQGGSAIGGGGSSGPMLIQKLATDPATPVTAQLWYNTTTNEVKYYNGTSIEVIAVLSDSLSDFSAPIADLNIGNFKLVDVADPTLATDAATKNYVDLRTFAIAAPAEISVAGSPALLDGTITLSWATETANRVFAGPTSGGSSTPGFRSLVAADIPNLPASIITTGQLALARGGTGVDLSASGSATAILAQDGSHVISARSLIAADIPNLDASKITTGLLALARGGTNADLSATGGSHLFLKQASVGAAITVVQPDYSDLSGTPQLPVSKVAVTSNWLRSYDSSTGLFTASQPAYSDITGTPTLAQTLANASHKWFNSYDAATGLFTQTQPAYTDLTGTPTLAQTIANASHDWLNSYDAATGLFTQTQPAFTDISGTAAAAQYVTMVGDSGSGGTKGAVPAPAAGDTAAGKFLKADGTWTTPSGSGSGTVTSVALTAPAEISVSGSPVTTSGTLALTWASQSGSKAFASPAGGGSGTPAFRQLSTADLSDGVTGSGAIVLATSPTLVTPTLGAASATSLAIGAATLQSDTGRYGTAAIRVQATGTNAVGVLTLMPSGSSTESDIRMYNTSDPANVGAVEISLIGTTMTFLTENFGTGTKPTTLDFSQFATEKAAAVTTSSTTQLQLQETGDALGIINMYLRNRGGQNGAIFENPSVCLADFGMQTSAIITNIAINGSNVLTVTAVFASVASSLPSVGQKVTLSGLTTATFLNAQVVTIATISATQFTASFTHALYASAADTGIAVAQNNVRAEFRNDKVLSTLNTSGEIQFFDPTNPGSGTWLASGITGTVIGDSLSATMVANFQRALMLIGTNAVMNVTRISASMTAAAPAVELAHATSNVATPDYFWDMFGNNASSVETLSIRRRTPEFSGVGSDAVIAQFDQNGGLTLPVALVSLLGAGGLPVQTNQPLVIAGGFSSPVAAKIYVGDGTGWELDFAKRIASADTTLFKMKDSGVFDVATGITIAGAATTGNVLRGNGTNFVSAALIAADIPSLAASKITSGTLALAQGGTGADLSGTGATSFVLTQFGLGAPITVRQLASSNLSDGTTGSGTIVLNSSPTLASMLMTGTITKYNNISTVNNGIPSEIAVVAIAARGSAVTSTILVASGTIAANGYYRVSWVSKLTRAASGGTPSSTMGPLTLTYTDAGDGTAATLVCAGTNDSGALGTTVTGNGVANHLNGIPALIFAKAGTAINYTIGYASAGTTSMLYDFEIVVEAL